MYDCIIVNIKNLNVYSLSVCRCRIILRHALFDMIPSVSDSRVLATYPRKG